MRKRLIMLGLASLKPVADSLLLCRYGRSPVGVSWAFKLLPLRGA